MFRPPHIPGQGPSSRCAPSRPPGPPESHPLDWPISSSPNPPPEPPSGAPERPPFSLPPKQYSPAAEPRITDAAGIKDLLPVLDVDYIEYDADDESDHLLDLGCAAGQQPMSLKQIEFSLKQFAKRMGQANYSVFNKWKKGWVAGWLEKKHRSIMQGQNHLKQIQEGPLHWETVVADVLVPFEDWLPLDNFDNAEWIRQQWVVMFLKKCASQIREARKQGRRGNSNWRQIWSNV